MKMIIHYKGVRMELDPTDSDEFLQGQITAVLHRREAELRSEMRGPWSEYVPMSDSSDEAVSLRAETLVGLARDAAGLECVRCGARIDPTRDPGQTTLGARCATCWTES